VKNYTLLTLVLLLISGCGSLSTIGKDDNEIKLGLIRNRTHCDAIPRIYSGVAYDFCRVNSVYDTIGADYYGGILFVVFMCDAAASFVVDTLALPYTVYAHKKRGEIYLSRRPRE
jgi:uncharacterized protein YceK